jgi:hypothetical protein
MITTDRPATSYEATRVVNQTGPGDETEVK